MEPSSASPAHSIKGASLTPSYRRNGKLQSCEPCRKGKLKCDHTLPTCGRCSRRGKSEACIYHPAPLTKARGSPSMVEQQRSRPPVQPIQPPPPARPSALSVSRTGLVSPPESSEITSSGFRPSGGVPLSNLVSNTSSPQLSSRDLSITRRTSSSLGGHYTPDSMSLRDNKTGFLGRSSYSAVFTENQNSLGLDENEASGRPASPPIPIGADRIHKGAEVLSRFRDLRIFESFLNRWFEIGDGITLILPIYGVWIRDILIEFDSVLQQYQRVEDLYPLSELVWRNTQKSLPITGTTSTLEWAALHTGQNLRWETVGAICSSVGLMCINLSNSDAIFNTTRTNQKTLTQSMKHAAEECINFCKESEAINDVYTCMLFESAILLESIRGDAFYGAWQRMGEVCDTVIMMGLHQEKRVDDMTPFFVAELRTRLFDQIYSHDKSISTFLGRPPRLSYRYCVTQLPLDLSDDEMLLEGAELQAAINRLENGWNTANRFHRWTWRRVWAQHAQIREDILEIALGTSEYGIAEKAQQTREHIRRVNEGMPDFVKTDIIDILNNLQSTTHPIIASWEPSRQPVNVMNLLCIHCGIRHTEFLLERSLINRTKTSTTTLIPLARELLRLVLAAIAKRDYLRDFQIDMVCMLAFHGLPAGGVLAIEMLKQEQSRQYSPDVLPRSETIQDLSVFISALATVGPGEGNHAICNQGRKVLKRVLDKILSPELPQNGAAGMEGVDQQTGMLGDDPSLYFPTGNDAEFLQWLENVEWDRGSMFGQT